MSRVGTNVLASSSSARGKLPVVSPLAIEAVIDTIFDMEREINRR